MSITITIHRKYHQLLFKASTRLYCVLSHENDDVKGSVIKGEKYNGCVVVNIKKIQKAYNTHRCAMYFDSKLIKTAKYKVTYLTKEA